MSAQDNAFRFVNVGPQFRASRSATGDAVTFEFTAAGDLEITLSGDLSFGGHILPSATATHDIGATATRWRDGWFSRDVTVGSKVIFTSAAGVGAPHVHRSGSFLHLGTTTAHGVIFQTNGAESLRLTADGRLLVGTTAAGSTGVGGIRAVGVSQFDAGIFAAGLPTSAPASGGLWVDTTADNVVKRA